MPFVPAVLLGAVSIPAWMLADDQSWWRLIGIATALAALCLIWILRSADYEWQSGPVAYLVLMWLFHFPLTLLVSLGTNLDSVLPASILSWSETGDWYRASAFADACAACFVLGCLFVSPAYKEVSRTIPRPNSSLYFTGMVTIAVSACSLLALFLGAGGESVFSESYLRLYDTLFGSTFTLACFMVSIGAILATLSSKPRMRWLPLVLQGAVTIVTLLTGARQYALVGVLVLAVIAAKVGLRVKPLFLTGGVLLVLLIISFVGATRQNGVLNSAADADLRADAALDNGGGDKIGPIAALAEMGGSLQTVSLTIGWIEAGDDLRWGGSYWLPIERGLGLLVPGTREGISDDPRAVSEVTTARAPTSGGSVVAEAFFNFGFGGVAVLFVLGCLLAYIERRARTCLGLAWGGVVLYAFTLEVRNWFVSVPAQILFGSLPIMVGLYFRYREQWLAAPALRTMRADGRRLIEPGSTAR
jgi:hypothetical protein